MATLVSSGWFVPPKRCHTCRKMKLRSAFPKHHATQDGRIKDCRECWLNMMKITGRRKEGGYMAAVTNKKKDPDFYKKIGAIGGKKSRKGGFSDRALASRAGRLGGKASRRKGGN